MCCVLLVCYDLIVVPLPAGKNLFDLKQIINKIKILRPPLFSRGQSSWLHIQRPGFNSLHYQIF
jgi:hypothetical protein